jgi:ketosteroid isomerase-like protein
MFRPQIVAPLPLLALLLPLSCGCAAPSRTGAPHSRAHAVAQVLDDFHDAAARADEPHYFSHFAPDGVFLGTDGSERWDVPAFRAYAHPHFAQGTGWTYRATARHVQLSPDGQVAWFDEVLDNASYGPCRGTGVLRRINGHWKIAQYNLTIPIPNELAKDVVEMIRAPRNQPATQPVQ